MGLGAWPWKFPPDVCKSRDTMIGWQTSRHHSNLALRPPLRPHLRLPLRPLGIRMLYKQTALNLNCHWLIVSWVLIVESRRNKLELLRILPAFVCNIADKSFIVFVLIYRYWIRHPTAIDGRDCVSLPWITVWCWSTIAACTSVDLLDVQRWIVSLTSFLWIFSDKIIPC